MKTNQKPTMKARVLDFVESKGTARFTEIQEFIVDQNFGEGTYKAAAGTDTTWQKQFNPSTRNMEFTRTKKANPYRGYYSAAFHQGTSYYPWSNRNKGYFLVGSDRLEKGEDGLYRVIRKKCII
jgi:hypothetical protein